jgi:hypothetical protein
MRGPTRREVVIGSAVAHALTVFALIWWARGLEAFASVGPWVVVFGAGSALGAEAGIRTRHTAVEPRVFDTLIGMGLLVLVVFAALRADGGLLPFLAAAMIGLGVGLRVTASQTDTDTGADAPVLVRLSSELGLAASAGGFAVMVAHPYALAGWGALMAVATIRRFRRAPARH